MAAECQARLPALGLAEEKDDIRGWSQISEGDAGPSLGIDGYNALQASINNRHPAHGPAQDSGHIAMLFQIIDQPQSIARIHDLRSQCTTRRSLAARLQVIILHLG